jgi:ABC-type antimicrobial peptide transport system permease subunit
MYSGVNLVGLALSLACVITIFRYVYGEFTVDRFNKKLDRIFVTIQEVNSLPGVAHFSGISNPNRETTFVDLTEHPGVERYSHFSRIENDEIDVDNRIFNATVLLADSSFLKITDYPVISGIHRLSDPHSALISKSFAQKLFGKANPVGKTFRHSTGQIVTITGVTGQPATKSSLSFDVVVSYELFRLFSQYRPADQTFVLLYPGVDYQTINKQYADYFDMPVWRYQIRHQLFPLSKVFFDKSVSGSPFKQGNYRYVTVLMAVGALILLAGVINYINIFTVVILRRGRELSIKKVFGAGGRTLYVQLTTENLLMTGIALIFAFLFVHTV